MTIFTIDTNEIDRLSPEHPSSQRAVPVPRYARPSLLPSPLLALLLAMFVTAVSLPSAAGALEFGEVGVGTQVVVVSGEEGNSSGLGVDLRTRFLWMLGFGISATNLSSNEEVWGASTYRANLFVHLLPFEQFDLYLSPGLAGERFADVLNPSGASTWYRLGGGAEIRVFEGVALGFDVHWTLPGERQISDYVDEYGEGLYTEYVQGLSPEALLEGRGMSVDDLSSISPSDALDVLPLDRLEYTVGLRYYF